MMHCARGGYTRQMLLTTPRYHGRLKLQVERSVAGPAVAIPLVPRVSILESLHSRSVFFFQAL